MGLAILTSSRADFGYFIPLLNLFKNKINYDLVVFGTHLSKKHGFTKNYIIESGYKIKHEVNVDIIGDSSSDISKIIGNTFLKFADFWGKTNYDMILCIGDRYEMFAAVSASLPFNIKIGHISGGEETFGAIDNIYRHSLTLMSFIHFTNTKLNSDRVSQIIGSSKNIFHTGSLGIDNIVQTKLYTSQDFKELFNFNIDSPFLLFTFHPETVNYKSTQIHVDTIRDLLSEIDQTVLVTMPNADTSSSLVRNALHEASKVNDKIFLLESLGSRGYYTALDKCDFVFGNSSSGIIEAASFSKYVINIGERQLGREYGNNIIHCKIDKKEIIAVMKNIKKMPKLDGKNIYGCGNARSKIFKELKKFIT